MASIVSTLSSLSGVHDTLYVLLRPHLSTYWYKVNDVADKSNFKKPGMQKAVIYQQLEILF